MSIRKIAAMGNPVLRRKSEPVPENEISSEKIQSLIKDMKDTMFEYDGIGLAAPQVHESLQVVVLVTDFGDENRKPSLMTLINPVIKPLTQETSTFWEGCLSVPGLRGKVARPNKIHLRAFNEQGEKLDLEISGFTATVIQHECDHLLGVLYVDKITDPTSLAYEKEYLRFHAREDEEAVD